SRTASRQFCRNSCRRRRRLSSRVSTSALSRLSNDSAAVQRCLECANVARRRRDFVAEEQCRYAGHDSEEMTRRVREKIRALQEQVSDPLCCRNTGHVAPSQREIPSMKRSTKTKRAGKSSQASGSADTSATSGGQMSASSGTETSNAQTLSAQTSNASQDAEKLLKEDHRTVERLFEKFESLEDADEKLQCAQEICKELTVHSMLEEEIFYPACRDKGVESSMLDEAQVEHDSAKVLISELIEQ